jgi:fatty acid desaturase
MRTRFCKLAVPCDQHVTNATLTMADAARVVESMNHFSLGQSETEPDIFHDPRLRSVAWRDLLPVSRLEIAWELLLPATLLAASLGIAGTGHYAIALGFSFMFFLAGLRLVHNAFHFALGLSRTATGGVLWILSLVMLGSMHAVKFNHLRHHRVTLGDGDVEGRSAEMGAWRALLFGPAFPVLLHATALARGSRKLRATVIAELAMNAAWIALVLGPLHVPVLRYHVIAMLIGQCLTAFFAVWTVHHHCDRTHYIARTIRNQFKNAITFNMFRHIEHHLFPAVPTCHLPELSKRIDMAAPELKQKIVF